MGIIIFSSRPKLESLLTRHAASAGLGSRALPSFDFSNRTDWDN